MWLKTRLGKNRREIFNIWS